MRDLFRTLTGNAISLAGSALTTASALVFLVLLGLDLEGRLGGPYPGLIAYLLVPLLFVLGLLLIPIGLARRRRRDARASRGSQETLPIVDLNVRRTRTVVLGFALLTAINLVLLATATYKGIEVTESTVFCATTCHTIMAPEATAHAGSVHARVPCVACHIGAGGSWFVRAKLSGTRQVVEALFDLYPRPIPAPVHAMRTARETCAGCHEAGRDVGDRRLVIRHRADDEHNTVQETVLKMHVGGRRGNASSGIHWHADPAIRIRYRADPKREAIDTVELTDATGRVTTFTRKTPPAPEAAGAGAPGEWRTMDCVDCHNRVAHPFQSPDREVDEAIERGLIDAAIPYVRRESVRLLAQARGAPEETRRALARSLAAYYEKNAPETASARIRQIAAAGRVLGDIHARNVFPAMEVTWGTYADQLGHMDTPGCFRCHDDDHVSKDGRAITQDCATCHEEESGS